LPQPLLAATANSTPVVMDVALGDGGTLLGQVVDPQSTPQAQVPVILRQGEQELAVGKTDANGYFSFSGLRGGVYQVQAADGTGMCRLWAPRTAPPAAQKGVLIVAGKDVVRGDCGSCPRLKCMLKNPWFIAGVVATAVAVPVIIHNSEGGGPTSP